MKKNINLLIVAVAWCAYSTNATAQVNKIEEKIDCESGVSVYPKFNASDISSFVDMIKKSVTEPEECYNFEVEGEVTLSFVVSKKGRIKNVKVTKSPYNALANNILKLVNNSEGWSPAEKDGKKVNYLVNVKIPFSFVKDTNNTSPRFNGVNAKGFEQYLQKKVVIPQKATAERIEGVVRVEFIVDKDGKLKDFKTIATPGETLTDDLISTIMRLGEWKPAVRNGEKVEEKVEVAAKYTLPQRLDREPTYRNQDFVYILDRDQLINAIKVNTIRNGDMEFDWYIYKNGTCEIRNSFSSSIRPLMMLQDRFERITWRPASYGGNDVSVRYRITINGGYLRYDTYIMMDEQPTNNKKKSVKGSVSMSTTFTRI